MITLSRIVGVEQAHGRHFTVVAYTIDGGPEEFARLKTLQSPSTERQAELAAAHVAMLNEQRFEVGMDQVIAALKQGANPFPPAQADFPWATRVRVLKRLLRVFVNAPAEDVWKWAPFIDNVSNAEFAALGLTVPQRTAVRNKVDELKTLRQLMLGYAGPGIEVPE